MSPTARKSASSASSAPRAAAPRKRKPATTVVDPAPDGPSREDQVRALAYLFYEERGCADGHDLDDWLRAEAAVGVGAS